MGKTKLFLLICLFLCSTYPQAESQMSAADITRERIEGKTYCTSSRGGKVCTTFKTNGRLYGRNGPWTSGGSYTVKDDGSVCLNWDNKQWQSGCRSYNSFRRR